MFGQLSFVTEWLDEFLLTAAASFVDASIGQNQLNDIANIVSMSSATGGRDYSAFWSVVNTALDYIRPFGLALVTTYFLMFLFDAVAKDQITVDGLIKVFIQLIIVVALIGNFDTIVNAILSASETIFNNIRNAFTDGSSTTLTGEDIVNTWAEGGGDTPVTILFQSMLLWFMHQISIIAIYIAIFSRLMELGWRIAFGPIGVANNFDGGANSAGIRYLKSIAGVALSGVAIFIVTACGFAVSAAMISEATLENSQTTLFGALGALLATAGAAIGIGNKIRDVVQ